MLRENPSQGDKLMYLKPLGARGDLQGGSVLVISRQAPGQDSGWDGGPETQPCSLEF